MQNGDVTAKYLYGANLISRKTDSNPEYYIFNAHGDVVNLIDHAQVETMRPGYDYDAFGNEKNPSATDTNPFRYCGEYFDKETGTYYLRARYYDPSIGRFTQQDSVQYTEKSLPTGNIIDPLSLNYYTYSANNPILYCDPSGNAWETVLDVVSLVESTATLIADPSIQNALFFTWDAASAVLPFIPGSYITKLTKFGSKYDDFSDFTKILSKSKHAENGIEFITSVKKGTNIIELANSGKYLMGTYGDMKKYTSGYNHAVEAHHLLEQRIFKNVMQTNDMLSVVIPHDLHKELTSLWKNVVPYNSDYTALLNNPIEFKKIINEVYKDYPEILDLALDYFDSLNLGDIK